jgi:DNA-damage-inducible protein D
MAEASAPTLSAGTTIPLCPSKIALAYWKSVAIADLPQASVSASTPLELCSGDVYRGLYGGLGMRDIRARKRLKGKEHVLDHMGSTELAANLFRATQTEEKLRRENVGNKDQANRIHGEVGRKVRKTIHELGGTMPENLPAAESIKKVENREKKRLKAGQKKSVENGPGAEP